MLGYALKLKDSLVFEVASSRRPFLAYSSASILNLRFKGWKQLIQKLPSLMGFDEPYWSYSINENVDLSH